MSVASAPYYWLICDGCGAKSTEDSEFSAWQEIDGAVDEATGSGWSISADGKGHRCEECDPFCEECDKPAGPLSGERDYHCEACWAALESQS